MTTSSANMAEASLTFVTFSVCGMQCALAIDDVEEIKRTFQITRVHGAPPYVNGVVNIRGQIVTVIDLGRRLGLENDDPDRRCKMVIIRKQGEKIGLLVDSIEDSLTIGIAALSAPPANLEASVGAFVKSVCRTDSALIAVIDRDAIAGKEFDKSDDAPGA